MNAFPWSPHHLFAMMMVVRWAMMSQALVVLMVQAVLGLQSQHFNISVNVVGVSGVSTAHTLSFPLADAQVEIDVERFCEQEGISEQPCRDLYDVVMERLQAEVESRVRKTVLNPQFDPVTTKSGNLPNSQWPRHPSAVQAEASGPRLRADTWQVMLQDEEQAWQWLLTALLVIPHERIVFVHSCLLDNQSPHVLLSLLRRLRESDLDAPVVVLHYGTPLTINVPADASKPPILYTHVSVLPHFFEVPTMRIVHKYAQHRPLTGATAQVLYLHTKGASYETLPPEIDDWTRMMLHFLVSQHRACGLLLGSGELDVVGTNLQSFPRALSGNFWWATAEYLSALEPLHHRVDKYAPERWVLTGRAVRLYVPHSGHFQHSRHRYPWFCYRAATAVKQANGAEEVEAVPAFPQWRAACLNYREDDYALLHHREAGYERHTPPRMSMQPKAFVLFNP